MADNVRVDSQLGKHPTEQNRQASFYPIGMDYGVNSEQVRPFHSYYAPLYSIARIVSYPVIILGSRSLWRKIADKRGNKKPQGSKEVNTYPKLA